jgi:oligopeptide/dipeptide ABC transporter ATP-binding protein
MAPWRETAVKPGNTPLLEIRNLKVHFHLPSGRLRAVGGVDLTLAAGETLGLVGESGCGKTVTALSILRLIPSPPGEVTGEIFFDGQDLLALPETRLRDLRGDRIAMVFQEPMTSLNPVFTIGDQVAEVLRQHRRLGLKAALEQASRALARVGLPDPSRRLQQYPHQLSGGLRQRVLIAMALACGPQLLIADEPTTALDVTIQAQILALLKTLKDQLGLAVLFITHNLGIVAQTADRVAVMYAGLMVEEAPTKQLFKHPRHPYTRGLLNSVPKLDFHHPPGSSLSTIAGQVPDLYQPPPGCLFLARCPQAMPRCAQPPPWIETAPGHRLRCWLYAC